MRGGCAGSEHVLAATDLGESRYGVARRAHRGLQRRLIGAQEGVGCEFLTHGGRHRRLVARAQFVDPARAREEGFVLRLDRYGEPRIRLGVLVPAIDPGLRLQLREFRERGPHLLRLTLEEPATAEREQRVAGKERVRSLEPEGDVSARVAGYVEHTGHLLAEGVVLAVGDSDVDAGDAAAVGARPDDGAAGLLLER